MLHANPPLVLPRQAAQAIVLFDPVGTNLPSDFDARPPPSVISGFSLLAADERRDAFPHKAIVDIEMTPDGRFLGARVPGGHSNVGGGNARDGLETLYFNAAADYLNGVAGRELFAHRPLPEDPARYAVHQARGLTALPGLDDDGERDLIQELANCKMVDPCRDAEPIDRALAQQFEYRRLEPSAPVPMALFASRSTAHAVGAPVSPEDPAHPDHARLQAIRGGVSVLDGDAGKSYDVTSERLSRSLLAASREARLGRVDHVVLGADGRQVFAVEGGRDDPWRRWAAVDVVQAARTPVAASDARLDLANRRIPAPAPPAPENAWQTQEPGRTVHAH